MTRPPGDGAAMEALMKQQQQHAADLEGVKQRIVVAEKRLGEVERIVRDYHAQNAARHEHPGGEPKPTGE